MSQQLKKEIKLYGDKAYGIKVSDYGLENGYLDYYTLSEIVGDSVLNNVLISYIGWHEWELANGCEEGEDGNYEEVYQYYIITDYGAQFLQDHTDEIVYYHPELDMYVWGITHFGTSWDYVLTDIKLI
jgi:hypothetical protein